MQKIIVVMPAYNEAPRIADVVASIPKKLRVGAKRFAVEAVVVDDASRDETAAEAKKSGATVLRHVINSGAGAATRTGLRYAEYHNKNLAYVVTIDADGQHSSKDVEKVVRHAMKTGTDMIVGNRLHANNKKSIPIQRRIINWGGSLFSRLLFNIKTKDTQSGLRLYTADVLPKIAYFTLDRYGFCTETLWHAVKHNIKVDEVPIEVSYSKEGLARGQSIWSSVEILRDLLKVRIAG